MTDAVYEMLWDCRHCGAKKLLGLTHRYCPECGAPQNAEFRYFPSDQDKVAVTDHVYYGKDVVCRYCGTYNGKKAKHCKDCGGPLAEGSEALTRQEQVHQGASAGETIDDAERERLAAKNPQPKEKKRSLVPVFIGVAAVALAALIITMVFWKRDALFTVAGHSWERQIDVERFGPVDESAWCDELPAGAKVTRRYEDTRSTEKIQVGEDCSMRKVDQGDGTFKETRECTPKYEDKPVKDQKCDYSVERWSRARTLSARGQSTAPAPNWPALDLKKTGCNAVGCEREGPRRETYAVTFKNAEDGDTGECRFDETTWRSFEAGKEFKAKVGVIGGWLDCDSLGQP